MLFVWTLVVSVKQTNENKIKTLYCDSIAFSPSANSSLFVLCVSELEGMLVGMSGNVKKKKVKQGKQIKLTIATIRYKTQ